MTVVSPLAASYVDKAATNAGTVADMAATKKTEKYSSLSSTYLFDPIAVENLGAFSSSTLNVLSDLGRRINNKSGDARETAYLFCRNSALQFRAFARHSDCRLAGSIAIQLLVLILFVFNPGDRYYLGYKKIIIIL